MKKNLLILLSIFATAFTAFGQKFEWVKQHAGGQIILDTAGNIYSVGDHITKTTNAGTTILDLHFTDIQCTDIAIDKSGNLLIAGEFVGTKDFDLGSGVYTLSATNAAMGQRDGFILKLASNGSFLWAVHFNSESYGNTIASIDIDESNNIICSGNFKGKMASDPKLNAKIIESHKYPSAKYAGDFFVVKLDSSANFQWAKQFGGSDYNTVYSGTIDNNGNLYLTGEFAGTTDFDPGSSIYNLASATKTESDMFLLKLDNNGTMIWAYKFGNSALEWGNNIILDKYKNIYINGGFGGTVDFDKSTAVNELTTSSPYDFFILKLDSSANFEWVNSSISGKISVTTTGNVYVAGRVDGTVDADPGTGVYNLTGVNDIGLIKLNTTGSFKAASIFGGNSSDLLLDLLTDKSENIFMSGIFISDSVDFDPSSTGKAMLKRKNSADYFLLKWSDPSPAGIKETAQDASNLKVFPNPAQNEIVIFSSSDIEVKITNVSGQTLMVSPILKGNNSIDISNFPQGIYNLHFQNKKGELSVRRFIKE